MTVFASFIYVFVFLFVVAVVAVVAVDRFSLDAIMVAVSHLIFCRFTVH